LAKKLDLSKHEGWNPLMICMIYEYGRGADSHWKPYFGKRSFLMDVLEDGVYGVSCIE
jgi:hypothetical protein